MRRFLGCQVGLRVSWVSGGSKGFLDVRLV